VTSRTRQPNPLSLAVALIGLSVASGANAAQYNARAAISPSVSWTDNICATESNKKYGYVATATPSGSLTARGKRASLTLSGHIQVNSLTNSQLNDRGCGGEELRENRKQYRPKVRASGTVDVIRQKLTVNYGARWDQNQINSRLSGGDDPFDRNGTGNNWVRYNISPTFRHRFPNLGSVNLRYSYDELINDKNKANDSIRQQVSAGFNAKGTQRFSWGLSARHSQVEYQNPNITVIPRRDSELQNARFNGSFQIGRFLGINGSIGKEWNNLLNPRFDDDGVSWQLGLRWTPTRRTSMSIGSGDRFFGKTPRIQLTHKAKRGTLNLNYNKKITYDRDILTSDDGLLPDFGQNDSLRSRSPIIDERVTFSYSHQAGSSNLTFAGYYSEQTRTLDNQMGTFKNFGVTYQPQLSARFGVSFLVNWTESTPRQRSGIIELEGNTSEVWTYSASLSRPINNRLSTTLTYQFTDRTTEQAVGDYQENRITATLSISL